MSVTPYSSFTAQSSRPKKASTRRLRSQPQKQASSSAEVRFLRSQPLPPKVQFLLLLQKGSSLLTFCLIGFALTAYAWTVYMPSLWSKEYQKLETLQRNERHLTTSNETLKNQLARKAERPESGLAQPHPSQALFLSRKPASADNQSQPLLDPKPLPLVSNSPIAY